jgi:hypothetical protein
MCNYLFEFFVVLFILELPHTIPKLVNSLFLMIIMGGFGYACLH